MRANGLSSMQEFSGRGAELYRVLDIAKSHLCRLLVNDAGVALGRDQLAFGVVEMCLRA
jgi:hypothetical protein